MTCRIFVDPSRTPLLRRDGPAGVQATGSELQIHLVIRGYFVAASNNAAGVLAVVDWCVADQDAHVLYQEVFYASHAARLVGTLGGEKDIVDQAIVRRVAETSLLLSSGASTNGLPRKVKDTYDQFNEAVAVLPSDFQSMGLVGAGPSSAAQSRHVVYSEHPINRRELGVHKSGEADRLVSTPRSKIGPIGTKRSSTTPSKTNTTPVSQAHSSSSWAERGCTGSRSTSPARSGTL